MIKTPVPATNCPSNERLVGAAVSAVSWARNAWCRVELLRIADNYDPPHVNRLELVFSDAAILDLDGTLDNGTELSRRPRLSGPRTRYFLPLSSARLTIHAASSQAVPLQHMQSGRAGATAPVRGGKRPSGPPGAVRTTRNAGNFDLRGFTIERLSFSLRGDCRLGVMRFKGRGRSLGLEKFDLAFVRPVRLAGRVRFHEGLVTILAIRRLPLTGKRGRRRRIANGLAQVGGCWEFAIRTDAGNLSIVAEDCVFVPM